MLCPYRFKGFQRAPPKIMIPAGLCESDNLLINPLARYLFDNEIFGNAAVTIEEIDLTVSPPELRCSKEDTQ